MAGEEIIDVGTSLDAFDPSVYDVSSGYDFGSGDWLSGYNDYSGFDYGSNGYSDYGTLSDVGNNYGWSDMATNNPDASTSWLSDLGSTLSSAYKYYQSSPMLQKLAGLGVNYALNQYGKNTSGSPPSYSPISSPTQYYNDPYTQAMMGQLSKQVMNSGAARGVSNPNRLASMVADKAYTTNLLPYLGLQAGQNQAQNTQNFQGWQAQANQNQSLYGGLGTGLQSIMNNNANMQEVQQLLDMVTSKFGNAKSEPQQRGREDALAGKPQQSEDPKYVQGYNEGLSTKAGA